MDYLLLRMEKLINAKLMQFASKNDIDKVLEEVKAINTQQNYFEEQINMKIIKLGVKNSIFC